MTRDMTYLHVEAQSMEPLSVFNPTIHVQRLEIQRFSHELLHDFRRFDQGAIRRVRRYARFRSPHHFRTTLRVVPMTMRQPEFRQLTLFLGKNRSHVRPNFSRCIDQDTGARKNPPLPLARSAG